MVSLAAVQPLLSTSAANTSPATTSPAHPTNAMVRAVSEAEAGLKRGEHQIAESRFRTALLEGLMLLAALQSAEGRLEEAKQALQRASGVAVETRGPRTSLALLHLHLGEDTEAIALLTALVGRDPRDAATRQLLAQALIADERPAEALQELEEARGFAPNDPELAFNLATGHLRLGNLEEARRLYNEVAEARPIARTHVLIGRTYNDFRLFPPAREALEKALSMDPELPRVHYFLGVVELRDQGRDGLEKAIVYFEKALESEPGNATTRLFLGTALLASRRFEAAIPHLAVAAETPHTRVDGLRFQGSALLGLDRPEEAATFLRQALEASSEGARERQLYGIHFHKLFLVA